MTTTAATAAAVNRVAGRRQMEAERASASNGAASTNLGRVGAVGGVFAAVAGDYAGVEMRVDLRRDAGDGDETSEAASAASGRAARAVGSTTAEIACGRKPTGRGAAGRRAMGRLSRLGTEADVAVGSTPSGVNDRARAERCTFLRGTALDGTLLSGTSLDGRFLSGSILGSTSLGTASLAGTSLGTAFLAGKPRGGTFLRGTALGGTFLSGTALDGTAAVDPAAFR